MHVFVILHFLLHNNVGYKAGKKWATKSQYGWHEMKQRKQTTKNSLNVRAQIQKEKDTLL